MLGPDTPGWVQCMGSGTTLEVFGYGSSSWWTLEEAKTEVKQTSEQPKDAQLKQKETK